MDYHAIKHTLKMFPNPDITLTIEKAYGTKTSTKEYGELLDLESGCWAAILGHNHKEIIEKITETLPNLLHTHQFFQTEHFDALITELTSAAGLLCNYAGTSLTSGSEAVSLGITLAEFIGKRNKKLSFTISNLGSSLEVRMPRKKEDWDDLDISRCLNCTEYIDCKSCGKFEHINYKEYAAFVFEPGNSSGLVLFPPDKLITYLVQNIKNSGGYLVVNEVTTGFGRTGKWFGFQHYSIFDSPEYYPDIMALGKGLGNGYPVSALLVKQELADIIEDSDFKYVQSHSDDPLGCIIARKVVEIINRDNLIKKGNQTGNYLRQKLNTVRDNCNCINIIRGRGMMNILILKDTICAKDIFKRLIEKGFFTGYSVNYNFIHMYAPLILENEMIDRFCEALEDIFEEIGQKKDN